MKFSVIFALLALVPLSSAKKKFVIDETLQKLRQDYRKFRTTKKLQLDKSFFEIYNAIGSELMMLQQPFEKNLKKWTRTCEKFPFAVLDDDVEKKLKDVCINGESLLQNTLKMQSKGLNTFFSGDLTSQTPPVAFLADLCSEIDTQVEEIWAFYIHNNSTCVAIMLKSFLPLFEQVIDEVIELGKNTKANVRKYFKKSESVVENAIDSVERVVEEINSCIKVRDTNECIRKLVK